MRARRFRSDCRALVIVLVAVTLSLPAASASAQGLFETLFGGLRRASVPTDIQAFAEPFTALGGVRVERPYAQTGPAKAYCVRTCDGRYFPVHAHAGMSAVESCRSLCPASQTRLYSGSTIDHAVANDGSRYADLANAFVYRQQQVAGCTCNGRDQFGLSQVDVKTDPTLRPGDIVATKSGLMAFTGTKNKVAEFTPVASYRIFSNSARNKLSEVKIMPPNPGANNVTPVTLPLRGDGSHTAQLSK